MNEQMTQFQVRRASYDDIPFLSWCNYESSSPAPGFCYWDPLLEGTNTTSIAFIDALFRSDALAYGRATDFFVIEENGIAIGGASGFVMDTQDYRPLRLDRINMVAGRLGWDAQMIEQFMGGYAGVWSDPQDITIAPPASWIIECVAVKPESRGRGVAKALLNAIIAEGARQGHSHAGISVTIGNEPAQKVYEALGFQRYVTYWSAYFSDQFPGTMKYRMKLN
ncbi:MAG: GNAT family N-acetyltransferase [Chloroflexota bacterium]|nr:GNAT family N-acetyltransferase [Chloroflexota bacterium]